MTKASKSSKEKGITVNTDEAESITSPRSDKKKVKKKKTKTNSSPAESSLILSSPESKGKKKKVKNKSPSGEKRKTKKVSPKKGIDEVIPELEGLAEEHLPHTSQPQHLDEKDDTLMSDGEASHLDGVSGGTLEDDINDEDDLDMIENKQMFDSGPPIGEIVATEDDVVSDMGDDAVVDGPPTMEIIDGVQIFYDPSDKDVCFDDRHHPGTMDWIRATRDCLDQFEGLDYSPPVYRAIKKKLKDRRFLVRTRPNERTSWREATKPEIIELFGEAFNEERRRIREGISDDDSGVDSSLQNSAAQSDDSFSANDIADEVLPRPNGANHRLPTPTSTPTPRTSNQAGPPHSSVRYNFDGDSGNESDVNLDKHGNNSNRVNSGAVQHQISTSWTLYEK